MRTEPKSNYHLEENNKYIYKVSSLSDWTHSSVLAAVTKHNKSKTYPQNTSKEKTKETEWAYISSLLDVEYLENDVQKNIFGENYLNRETFLTAMKNITIWIQ